MDDARLDRALQAARRALQALAAGDDEAFALAWAAHESECLAIEDLDPRQLPALDELVAVDTAILHALDSALAETSGRMAMLRRSGRTQAAYAASTRPV